MNTTMNPPPIPRPTLRGLVFEPMPEEPNPASVLETLLKQPGRIVHDLHHRSAAGLPIWLLGLGLMGMALYGLIVGMLSGGPQLWVAPAKMALGTLLAMIICLPSLYIFVCLDGIETRIRTVSGLLFAAVCLAALLLVGFAPVGWIFSQSTDSIPLIGALHLLFWIIAVGFGLRLLNAAGAFFGSGGRLHLKLWNLIFILVCLQMTATLRPIIGRADTFFPGEKKFFIAHWMDTMAGRTEKR
ncbi:MAG: hypothetical protein ABIR71_12510 [Chthoniobacterales bacterium]